MYGEFSCERSAIARAVAIGLTLLAAVVGSSARAAEEASRLYERLKSADDGAVIELPAGTFELPRTLVIDRPVSIVGRGKEATILRSVATAEGPMLQITKASNVRLADFTLDAAGNHHVTQGIVMSHGGGHRLEGLRIRNLSRNQGFGPHGIYASRNIVDSQFLRNEIENVGLQSAWGAGIRIGEGGRGNLIEGNVVRNVGRGGILTTRGSTDTRIANNQVRDFGFSGPGLGIEIWGSGERAVIEDNRVDHWISVDGQTDVAVRRNTITGSQDSQRIGSYGLELVNSRRVVMTDNVMHGGNHIGLSVSNRARKDLVYWARNRFVGSETWGAQIQGEEGGAHRMYFYRNVFENSRKSDRSNYPGAAGHGFRFNGNADSMVLDSNRLAGNQGAGIQLGGQNLERLIFVNNTIVDNAGAAVVGWGADRGEFRGDHILWENNAVTGNGGGDRGFGSKGFDPDGRPELQIAISGDRRAGPLTFGLQGAVAGQFSEVLWDLGEGIPATGETVEHRYASSGKYQVAAIAWAPSGRGVLVETVVTIGGEP